jgi:hypothetical protein
MLVGRQALTFGNIKALTHCKLKGEDPVGGNGVLLGS